MGSLKTVERLRQRIIDTEKSAKAFYMGVWGCARYYLEEKFGGKPNWGRRLQFGLPASMKNYEWYVPKELYLLLTTRDPTITFWYLQALFSLFEELITESCSVICTTEEIDSSKYEQVKKFLAGKNPYNERKDGVERVLMADSTELAKLKLAKETRNCFIHNDSKVDGKWRSAHQAVEGKISPYNVGDKLPTTLPDVEHWQILISKISARLVMETKSQSHVMS